MATQIFGSSDDLIEFRGDVNGEVARSDAEHMPHFIFASDGTVLRVKYGKEAGAIWEIEVIEIGSLFDSLTMCADEDDDPYSDVVEFKDGLKFCYVANGAIERAR